MKLPISGGVFQLSFYITVVKFRCALMSLTGWLNGCHGDGGSIS